MNNSFDCIVIGGGPAGLEAATYLARFRRKVLLIDAGQSRVRLAPQIMNLGGYEKGISGKALLKRMRRQALKFGTRFVKGTARVRRARRGFTVAVDNMHYLSKFVIMATGVVDEQPEAANCGDLCQKRLLAYCPICDGYEHTGKKIAVLVNRENALSKARFIRSISKDLHIVNLSKRDVSGPHRAALAKMGVRLYSGPLLELAPVPGKRVRLTLKDEKPLVADVVYVELGVHVPQEASVDMPQVSRTEHGRYHINEHRRTSLPGLYAIGDCANSLSQISVALGEAALAATEIHNALLASP